MNFIALNLLGIMSLHLLTTKVGLLSLLKLVKLFLQTTKVTQSLTSRVTCTLCFLLTRVECTSLDLTILSL